MKILVTGGAGFIGSHLCERLLGQGHEVVCADNLSTGRTSNTEKLKSFPAFSFLEHDVRERTLRHQPKLLGVKRIYNLACPASPPQYQLDPIGTMETCVLGAINLAAVACDHDARVLQASTSEVYGDPEETPQTESYTGNVNTTGPRACYDEGKRAAETVFADAARSLGADVRIARIFNTYGPRMDPEDGRVVSNFIRQALLDQPLTVYGDGLQTRSFCYVDDMVSGLIAVMEGSVSDPVNLGNPNETTMLELASTVLRMCGKSQGRLEHKELPEDDPKRRRPNIWRARKVLDWHPTTCLTDGLERTIAAQRVEMAKTAETVSGLGMFGSRAGA